MIPHILRLRNFMSYGDEPVEVDFDGFRLACLSGGNGHGKSALLDAITWALWGRSRAKREDDLVYYGAREMRVELDFSVAGGYYRVIRGRTLRPSGGSGSLELQLRGENGYSSLTGGTMAETQRRLDDILRLGYDTFINSTFLLQGRADEFTIKPPAQRKAVLGEILGLEQYERLSERAREQSRRALATASAMRESIAGVEGELARRPALREERAGLEGARDGAVVALQEAERSLWEARLERQRLEGEERALIETQRRSSALTREIETLTRRRDEATKALHQSAQLLADEARIAAGAAELRRARDEADEMGARAGRVRKLDSVLVAIQQEIEGAAAQLHNEVAAACKEAEKAALIAADEPARRRQVEDYARSEARAPQIEEERIVLAGEIEALRGQIAVLQNDNTCLESEMKPLRERLKLLQEKDAACPICKKPMDDVERRRLYEEYRAEGVAKNAQLKDNWARQGELTRRLDLLQQQDKELVATLAAVQKHLRGAGAAQHRLQEAENARIAEQEARGRAEAARLLLNEDDFAHEARARLVGARQAVQAVGYDDEQYECLRARVRELAPLEAAAAELATARERQAGARDTLLAVEGDLARRGEELASVRQNEVRLRAALADLPAVEARRAACERNLEARRGEADRLNNQVAALDGRLRLLDEQEESLRAKRSELSRYQQEGDAYAELGRHFGKAGIQAMMIDNALPELEQGANRILARMSDNAMQVQFSTQAQSAKGEVMETLDIRIADAHGTRPYEMYSGGEAFRVNFAVRIALSRLLAERAGAQLQMLVVDEGFGTQDSQGRERLVEAIASIAADFEKIIIITHIDELKDLFSTRIEVVKDLAGSRVTVTAA